VKHYNPILRDSFCKNEEAWNFYTTSNISAIKITFMLAKKSLFAIYDCITAVFDSEFSF
jgi:hypothetical protein